MHSLSYTKCSILHRMQQIIIIKLKNKKSSICSKKKGDVIVVP